MTIELQLHESSLPVLVRAIQHLPLKATHHEGERHQDIEDRLQELQETVLAADWRRELGLRRTGLFIDEVDQVVLLNRLRPPPVDEPCVSYPYKFQ